MRTTYATFGEAARALGIKVKEPAVKSEKSEKIKKCRKCGGDLRHIAGTNIYVCNGSVTRENTSPDGTTCSVVEPCGNVLIARG